MIRRKKIQAKPKLFSKPGADNLKKPDDDFSANSSKETTTNSEPEVAVESTMSVRTSQPVDVIANVQPVLVAQVESQPPPSPLSPASPASSLPSSSPPASPREAPLRTSEPIQPANVPEPGPVTFLEETVADSNQETQTVQQTQSLQKTMKKKEPKSKSRKNQQETVTPKNKNKKDSTKKNKKKTTADDEEEERQPSETIEPKRNKKRKKKNDENNSEEAEVVDGNRRKRHKKWDKNVAVDKNKLTMFDLISYNPPPLPGITVSGGSDAEKGDNPLDGEEATANGLTCTSTGDSPDESRQNNVDEEDQNSANQTRNERNDREKSGENEEEGNKDGEGEEERKEGEEEEGNSSIGPRVRVNENGELVLDEKSLVVKRKTNKSKVNTVYEDEKSISSLTNYSSFRRKGKQLEKKSRWSDSETVKFYTALTIIGTDFTLMAELFFRNKRSRMDLKNKFKSEERSHKKLIDNALKKSDLENLNNLELLGGMDALDDEEDNENALEDFIGPIDQQVN